MTPFSALSPRDVDAWVRGLDLPGYRADQVLRWFYRSSAEAFEAMSNLPVGLRERLSAEFQFTTVAPEAVSGADAGETRKYLYRLERDGELLEAVAMHYPGSARSAERTTVCLSTQVGCAVGCPFCATGQLGLRRNLAAGEIVDQVLVLARRERAGGGRVSHLVYMGMGEPLHNVEPTLESARRFCDPRALGLSPRRVTISTSGVVPGIDRLAAEGGGVNLAVSLHAPVDELRDTLVPLNRRWPVAQVVAAADRYAAATGRRVSFEYVMLRDVNDSPELAGALGNLLRGRLAHVNLIPYNAVPGDPYQASSKASIDRFRERLREAGVECTVRDTRGRRIEAACGQLHASVTGGQANLTVPSVSGAIIQAPTG